MERINPANEWKTIYFRITRKKIDLAKSKGEKITSKKAYDTVDWNKKNNKRKEVQKMIQKAQKKEQKNKWNDSIKKENDTNINIEKTKKTKEFVLTKSDEVTISNEAEEILMRIFKYSFNQIYNS